MPSEAHGARRMWLRREAHGRAVLNPWPFAWTTRLVVYVMAIWFMRACISRQWRSPSSLCSDGVARRPTAPSTVHASSIGLLALLLLTTFTAHARARQPRPRRSVAGAMLRFYVRSYFPQPRRNTSCRAWCSAAARKHHLWPHHLYHRRPWDVVCSVGRAR